MNNILHFLLYAQIFYTKEIVFTIYIFLVPFHQPNYYLNCAIFINQEENAKSPKGSHEIARVETPSRPFFFSPGYCFGYERFWPALGPLC